MDKVDSDDKKWKAESDVRTMIDYGEIMKDKDRYKRAMTEAKAQAEKIEMATKDMSKMGMEDYEKARKS